MQLATAAAPEGPASLARWHALGAAAAAGSGSSRSSCPSPTATAREDPENAALVEGAGLVYLSGGNPGYLAQTLRGTAVWEAIVAAWHAGAALAGCSAGAMALSAGFPDIRRPWRSGRRGARLVPACEVLPHFDRFGGRMPDWSPCAAWAGRRTGVAGVGVDEDTALVGGLPRAAGRRSRPARATAGQVLGRQSVWLLGARNPGAGGRRGVRRERRPPLDAAA